MCTWCAHGVQAICKRLIGNWCTCGAHHVHKGVTLRGVQGVSFSFPLFYLLPPPFLIPSPLPALFVSLLPPHFLRSPSPFLLSVPLSPVSLPLSPALPPPPPPPRCIPGPSSVSIVDHCNLFKHDTNVVPSVQISFSHHRFVSCHIHIGLSYCLTKRKSAKLNT